MQCRARDYSLEHHGWVKHCVLDENHGGKHSFEV